MKYQTEYQRNYQNRSPKKFHELSAEERKLNEVPIRRASSSPTRRRQIVANECYHTDDDYALVGPSDNLNRSSLYRLKRPFKHYPHVAKSQEYILLGKNAKFEDNVIYRLRNPVVHDSPKVVVRKRERENHSCGIQAELDNRVAADDRNRQRNKRIDQRSEYKHKYVWKQPSKAAVDNAELRDRRLGLMEPAANVDRPTKVSVGVNTPARVEVDVSTDGAQAKRTPLDSTKSFVPKKGKSHGRRRPGKRPVEKKGQKAFEAEEVLRQKRREPIEVEHAHTDDEDIGKTTHLGKEFQEKYPYGKLRRWKSEYQATYKPFWRFDFKDGKWYKDSSTEEKGFNPNLFWYQELMATRQRANEYRANAERDHFNPDYTLQLQSGFDANNKRRAWDICDGTANGSDESSVISVDRDLERERIECQRRREKDARRHELKHTQYPKPVPVKVDQTMQTDHATNRVIYVDGPPVKQPSLATKAFVRNLASSSIQQHMSWDSESVHSQDSYSDIDSYRKQYLNDKLIQQKNLIRKGLPIQKDSRGTITDPSALIESQQNNLNNPTTSSQTSLRSNKLTRSATCCHRSPAATNVESHNATGRPSDDTRIFDRRPHTSMNEYCSYQGSRFKDEVTDYYYGRDANRQRQNYSPAPKSSFQKRSQVFDRNNIPICHTCDKDDDALSVRSLASSCSLASQTLERAQDNMRKYWGQPISTSKKPCCAKD